MFVLLSAATPTRLLSAFPPGVTVSRVPLEVAIRRVAERLSTLPAFGHQAENAEADEGLA